jgi:hypothetical protein
MASHRLQAGSYNQTFISSVAKNPAGDPDPTKRIENPTGFFAALRMTPGKCYP